MVTLSKPLGLTSQQKICIFTLMVTGFTTITALDPALIRLANAAGVPCTKCEPDKDHLSSPRVETRSHRRRLEDGAGAMFFGVCGGVLLCLYLAGIVMAPWALAYALWHLNEGLVEGGVELHTITYKAPHFLADDTAWADALNGLTATMFLYVLPIWISLMVALHANIPGNKLACDSWHTWATVICATLMVPALYMGVLLGTQAGGNILQAKSLWDADAELDQTELYEAGAWESSVYAWIPFFIFTAVLLGSLFYNRLSCKARVNII